MSTSQRRGHPLQQTRRGKLQEKRSKINEEISREMRIKMGAENLLRATDDPKLRRQVELELNFMNSHLQFLGSRLGSVNSSIDDYQSDKSLESLPAFPIGLKETRSLNFSSSFKMFIREHYFENGEAFDEEVEEFGELRRLAQFATRDRGGVEAILSYYAALEFVDRRFLSSGRDIGIYFEWFDALTGSLTMQKSVAYEKASMMFNLAALYSQIGAREDRTSQENLQVAASYFAHAAGCYEFIAENFSHPPSTDLKPETLEILSQLMLAQAQECIYEICCHETKKIKSEIGVLFGVAKEAAFVSKKFEELSDYIRSLSDPETIPSSWADVAAIKENHYKSCAHLWTGHGILTARDTGAGVRRLFRNQFRPTPSRTFTWDPLEPPSTLRAREQLAERHFRLAIQLSEEAMEVWKSSRDLRNSKKFRSLLYTSRDRVQRSWDSVNQPLVPSIDEAADISAASREAAIPILPDLAFPADLDIFWKLGPLRHFCSMKTLTPPLAVTLSRRAGSPGFGFSICGEAPVVIADVESGGLAEMAGITSGDVIIRVADQDTKWATHDLVVTLILTAGDDLSLSIVREKRQFSPIASPSSCSARSSSLSSASFQSAPTIPSKSKPSCMQRLRGGSISHLFGSSSSRNWGFRKLFHPLRKTKSEITEQKTIPVYKSTPQLYVNYNQINVL